jgi:vancomycin resistance protein YoaR
MKKILIGLGVVGAAVAVGLSVVAARTQPVIRENTFVGPIEVGGMLPQDAEKKLRIWWETEKRRELAVSHPMLNKPLRPMTPSQLGLTIDDQGSVAQLPLIGAFDQVSERTGIVKGERASFPVKFRSNGKELSSLRSLVEESVGELSPARAEWKDGVVVRTPERTSFTLDMDGLSAAVVQALTENKEVTLPIKEAEKRVPDSELEKIREVVAEFSTRFPSRQTNRNQNIRIASERLDGVVLMPGDRVSFNKTVGKRTIQEGFRLAPVYASGRHDTGVGGGICQVSSTLYNAALFADLKVVKRQNHSMPVAYVPVGRDAAVDYNSIDLVIENNFDQPIAVCSTYVAGKLTFRILGQKQVGKSIKLVSRNHSSWDRGLKTISDPSLPAGSRRVVHKGGRGHSIEMFREVYQNGQLVRKDSLGRSYYMGGVRVVAVGSRAASRPSISSQEESGTIPEVAPDSMPSEPLPDDEFSG